TLICQTLIKGKCLMSGLVLQTEMVKNWLDAESYCASQRGHLASFHTQEELKSFLSTYTKGKSKWIGLKHNPTDGGYHWSDATPVSHTNWGHGEPNNHEGREDCVEMVSNTNGTSSWWNDLNCDTSRQLCPVATTRRLYWSPS
uniref:C-type lectin domain-containing protein n=1 Tax=Oncorhynchus mykiss TaxID=8022 RepID=A0A8L0DLS2_ONCMY